MNLKIIERLVILAEVIVLVLLLAFQGGIGIKTVLFDRNHQEESQVDPNSGKPENKKEAQSAESAESTKEEVPGVLASYPAKVEKAVNKMNNEEKVAQLFVISFDELTETENANLVGDKTKTEIDQYPVSGIIFGMNNFVSTDQFTSMLSNLETSLNDRVGLSPFIMLEESLSFFDMPDLVTKKEDIKSLDYYDAEDASSEDIIDAINDGKHLIYNPKDFREVYKDVLDAVENGEIKEDTLDICVGEIVSFKKGL